DIQICPLDGDVWIATSAGITRYSVKTDSWRHYTREDGLPEDQASSLTFDSFGNLIVGTQCHGLSFFNRDTGGKYRVVKKVSAPFRFGPDNCSPVPLMPRGEGLPSDLVNHVLIASDNTIYAATNAGIVWSKNGGATWQYLRGLNYADKVKGLYGGAPKEWQEVSAQEMAQLLPEDHITCLAEDPTTGMILFGTRLKGIGVFDPLQEQYVGDLNSYWKTNDRFIRAIVPLSDRRVSFGCYLGGFTTIDPKKQLKSLARKSGIVKSNRQTSNRQINTVATKNFPPHPSVIKPPTLEEIKAMQAKLELLNEPLPTPYAGYLGEDWKTQGDWTGRTAKNWTILCAAASPLDQKIIFSEDVYRVSGFIGPNATPDDCIRRWCHWIKTDNPRSLWNPLNGYRRQTEWDDHGEAYPWAKDGPDLWTHIQIKHEGTFRVGFYFFNKDGHGGANRMRDYCIEVYPCDKQRDGKTLGTQYSKVWKEYSMDAEMQTRKIVPLVKSRMRDFWGGCYKQFVVTGPANYYIKVDRNYCFNVAFSAVMIVRLTGTPVFDEAAGIPWVNPYRYDPPPFPEHVEEGNEWQIISFWNTLENQYNKCDNIELQGKYRTAVYQAATGIAHQTDDATQIAKSLKWRLNQWDEEQRKEWLTIMKQAFDYHYNNNESLRNSIIEQKDGPPKFFLERKN
ncbi:MAG: hypothetical protein LBJ67_03020, partial [Planctomycetaceae bacterium]|nr:hypothetical protein [Planctomycetaceae bacterium]